MSEPSSPANDPGTSPLWILPELHLVALQALQDFDGLYVKWSEALDTVMPASSNAPSDPATSAKLGWAALLFGVQRLAEAVSASIELGGGDVMAAPWPPSPSYAISAARRSRNGTQIEQIKVALDALIGQLGTTVTALKSLDRPVLRGRERAAETENVWDAGGLAYVREHVMVLVRITRELAELQADLPGVSDGSSRNTAAFRIEIASPDPASTQRDWGRKSVLRGDYGAAIMRCHSALTIAMGGEAEASWIDRLTLSSEEAADATAFVALLRETSQRIASGQDVPEFELVVPAIAGVPFVDRLLQAQQQRADDSQESKPPDHE